jgi:hypothetical protein
MDAYASWRLRYGVKQTVVHDVKILIFILEPVLNIMY